MEGCGESLEDLIRQQISKFRRPEGRPYTLLEIGSANCVTLRSFRNIIAETIERSSNPEEDWVVIGTDLPPGAAWSMDRTEVLKSIGDVSYSIITTDRDVSPYKRTLPSKHINLILDSMPRDWLAKTLAPESVDFVFIDGSHGVSCAKDFCAIEQKVAPNGLVVFHDYGEPEQGTDWQACDGEFISVRTWVHRLGLNKPNPADAMRPGWRFMGEIRGTRYWGGEGNSCAVVHRLPGPLSAPDSRLFSCS